LIPLGLSSFREIEPSGRGRLVKSFSRNGRKSSSRIRGKKRSKRERGGREGEREGEREGGRERERERNKE